MPRERVHGHKVVCQPRVRATRWKLERRRTEGLEVARAHRRLALPQAEDIVGGLVARRQEVVVVEAQRAVRLLHLGEVDLGHRAEEALASLLALERVLLPVQKARVGTRT